jgi:hypothetical protein
VRNSSYGRSEICSGQLQAQQTAGSGDSRTVSPVLLFSGLTAAIAMFCLLLIASCAATGQATPKPATTATTRRTMPTTTTTNCPAAEISRESAVIL